MRCWSRAAAIKASPCAPQGRGTYVLVQRAVGGPHRSFSQRQVGRTAPSPRAQEGTLAPPTYVVSPRTVNQGDPQGLCLRADDQH